MKYQYFFDDKKPVEILKNLNISYNSLTVGEIPTGEKRERINPDGSVSMEDVTRQGIEIDLEDDASVDELDKVDKALNPNTLKKFKNLEKRIKELEDRLLPGS